MASSITLTTTLEQSDETVAGGGGGTTAVGGGGGGTNVSVTTIDASGSDTTEQLPSATDADNAVAVRTDTSSKTATIEDPDGNTIYWPGRTNATSFDFHNRQAVFFTSDGSNWYVENPAVYEIGSFVPGALAKGRILLRHRAEHDLETVTLLVDCETADSSDPTDLEIFTGTSGSFGTPTTQTINAGTNTTSFSITETIAAGDVLKVVSPLRSDIEDLSLTFDVIRV